MSYVVALLAFAAVMIVLATLVTVVVEALHGIAGLRHKHFRVMLASTFEQAVSTRAWPEGGDTGSANDFVAEISANPALGRGAAPRDRWLQRLPLLGRLLDRDLHELDTRQFVEQLAYSRAGRALAAQADEVLETTLDEIAREFERLGQAASAFFAARARALSLLAATLVAVVVNVDALALYRALATDRQLASEVVGALDVRSLADAALLTDPDASSSTSARDDEASSRAIVALRDAVLAAQAERTRLGELGLPLGKRYFPYCATPADAPRVDARCPPTAGEDSWLTRSLSASGLGWLLSTLLAAGLIGLGAPFWFGVYRALGSMLPGFKASDSSSGRPPDGTRTIDSTSDTAVTSPAALLRAFRIASRSAASRTRA